MRGDRDVEGVQYPFCSYGGALDFFLQYQFRIKINRQHFALEIAFEFVDDLHLDVREDQINRLIQSLTQGRN